jgi:hypothetical protein
LAGKLEFSFTGLWRVIGSADGGSYKHPTWWSPYPAELIPFKPVDGPNTQYSQLHKAVNPHPFKEAGMSGFLPPQPFTVPAKFINVENCTDFWWPTLSELSNDIDKFPLSSDKERHEYFEDDTPFCLDVMYTGPPPEPPMSPLVPEHSTPSIMSLAPLIIISSDTLFFISYSIGGSC